MCKLSTLCIAVWERCWLSLQIALSCCLVALFTMCLWFVRVSFIQRQRQIQFELELAQNPPPTMTPEDMQRLELIQYKVILLYD